MTNFLNVSYAVNIMSELVTIWVDDGHDEPI